MMSFILQGENRIKMNQINILQWCFQKLFVISLHFSVLIFTKISFSSFDSNLPMMESETIEDSPYLNNYYNQRYMIRDQFITFVEIFFKGRPWTWTQSINKVPKEVCIRDVCMNVQQIICKVCLQEMGWYSTAKYCNLLRAN